MSPPGPSDDLAGLDQRGRAFLRRGRALRGLSPHQVDRIARRLKERRPLQRQRLLVRAAAAAALVLMAGTAAAWAGGALGRFPALAAFLGRGGHRPTPTPAARPSEVVAVPPSRQTAGEAPRPASEPAPEAPDGQGPGTAETPRPEQRAPQPPLWSGPRRHGTTAAAGRVRKTSVDRPDPEAEAGIVVESRSLAAALELWRTRQNVPAALAALDEHDRRFPQGAMGVEARALRAEILLAARREDDALAVLDRLPLDQVPRGRELRTVRGELRVRRGRCPEGRLDLESISRGADALATRARAAMDLCP